MSHYFLLYLMDKANRERDEAPAARAVTPNSSSAQSAENNTPTGATASNPDVSAVNYSNNSAYDSANGIRIMNFVNKMTGGTDTSNDSNEPGKNAPEPKSPSNDNGSFLGGIGDKLNSAAGGGKASEKNEDYLDKGIDFVQDKVLGQGPQDNESALEQAKDEQI
ncbi:hypothetical protein MBLNU230_g5901t1 [Neophaeotheca triangularis]